MTRKQLIWFLFAVCFGGILQSARAQDASQKPRVPFSRSARFVMLDRDDNPLPLGTLTVQGGLPLNLLIHDRGIQTRDRRVQVFVAIYAGKGTNAHPSELLTTWVCPEMLATPRLRDGATTLLRQPLPLPPGWYAVEIYLCDPDEPFVDGPTGFPMAEYHPERSVYPGRVLAMHLLRVDVVE